MTAPLIEIKNLSKKFGSLLAVDDLSLSIGPGEVFGFIGPNGAGKSTTMKILACLLKPDTGSAKVCGFDAAKDGDKIRRVLGYMPDFLGVYDDLTVDEYLQFFASAFRIERRRRRAVVDSVLELTDLMTKKGAPVDSLSRGMQQRLGVARVLIHEPKVLLLDEPASGLDPRARIEMRSLITELARMGKCLMVSSHILTELGEMSTSIGIIERGKLLYAGSLADAFARVKISERIIVTLEAGPVPAELVRDALVRDPRVASVVISSGASGTTNGMTNGVVNGATAPGEPSATPLPDEAVAAGPLSHLTIQLAAGEHGHHFLLEAILACGARISAFMPERIKLEDAFLKLTTGALQ